MRRVIAVAMSAGLGLAALGGAALADNKGPGLFERSDKDGDGFVTKEEFAAGRDVIFSQIDANSDGVLDQAELDKAHEAFRQRMSEAGKQPKPEGEHRARFMKRLDTDEDGKITAAEFSAAGERMFAKLDDNTDGKLAKDEMRHRHHGAGNDPATGEAPAP